ncbi:hypothetical protein PIB30_106697, partial [Stylosanthes scabra]|nr:hypothetical protein [Stylosanthes scabra]
MVWMELQVVAEFVVTVVFNLSVSVPIRGFSIQVSLAPLQVVWDLVLSSPTARRRLIVGVVAAAVFYFAYFMYKRREVLRTIPSFVKGQRRMGTGRMEILRAVISAFFHGEPLAPDGYEPLAQVHVHKEPPPPPPVPTVRAWWSWSSPPPLNSACNPSSWSS